ncbi:MAG: AMP-binding protein, partial [Rhodocyclaceae bacterium]|nr:AMP-binding protein [Rhodocyclaceae bacterium]
MTEEENSGRVAAPRPRTTYEKESRVTGNKYDQGLDRNPANYVPLSPLSYLERSAQVYPDYPSVIHGARRFTWAETYARCRRLAGALAARGIGRGDTVAVML